MSLTGLLLGLALLAPAGGSGDGVREGDPSLFMDLFGHITPHAVAAVWWGGDIGLGFVKPYPHGPDGAPLEGDADHPVTFHGPHEFEEYYTAELGGGGGLLIYNTYTVMWFAGIVLLLVFIPMTRKARALAGETPRGLIYNSLESTVLYVRDEMVYPVMGPEIGRRFMPLFLTQFFFILCMNILGLIPLGPLGGTATAWWMVTLGLALTTFLAINLAGMRQFGPVRYWKNYAPHGVPTPVAVGIGFLEVILTLLVKPAALMVRLAANLTAGHLIVLSLLGLVYYFNSYVIGLLPLAMAMLIYGLELFVCFVQAYIFTYLSIVFVGAAVHPEH